MPTPIRYRDLVVPEHLAFFDHVTRLLEARRGAAPVTLSPAVWAALCTALVESVQAHRHLAGRHPAARARLPLAERLLTEITDAERVDDVLPPEVPPLLN